MKMLIFYILLLYYNIYYIKIDLNVSLCVVSLFIYFLVRLDHPSLMH